MDAGRERGRLNPDCHSESKENIGMPTPENFELPVINPRKVGPGQPPKGGRKRGVLNAITRDLKAGILNGAIEHGSDGEGTGGLNGYLQMCAGRHPKAYMALLGRLLPHVIKGDGPLGQHIEQVNIVSIPSGSYLPPDEIRRLSGQVEHQDPPLSPKPFENVVEVNQPPALIDDQVTEPEPKSEMDRWR
jgi:hypothetical protein